MEDNNPKQLGAVIYNYREIKIFLVSIDNLEPFDLKEIQNSIILFLEEYNYFIKKIEEPVFGSYFQEKLFSLPPYLLTAFGLAVIKFKGSLEYALKTLVDVLSGKHKSDLKKEEFNNITNLVKATSSAKCENINIIIDDTVIFKGKLNGETFITARKLTPEQLKVLESKNPNLIFPSLALQENTNQ